MENKIELKNIDKEIEKKHIIKRFIWSTLALLLFAISYNLFILPNSLVAGGVSGIAVMTKSIIDPSVFIFIVNIFLLIISFIVLGKEKTKGSLYGAILYPIFIQLTANVGDLFVFENNELLLSVLFGGFLSGVAGGTLFKHGYSTGGTDIISQIVSKLFKTSMGKSLFIIDGIIILVGGLYFGIVKVMYAVVYLYIYSLMADRIMLGISDNKAFYIITEKDDEVKKFVLENLNHGVTILKAKGGYEGHEKNVLLCVVPARHYFKLKEGISLIDNKAFFVVTDAYEVKGGA